MLLELGMAEASAGVVGWPEHLQRAVDAAPNVVAAAEAAMVLGLALIRAHRYVEAVEALDRAALALDSGHAELAQQLEAAAVVAGLNDSAIAPSMALRREVLRERAGDQAAPAELLAVASFISILSNEPAEVGARLATRALAAEGGTPPGSDRWPWFSSAALRGRRCRWFGRSGMPRCGRCLMARSRRPGRSATAAGLPTAWRAAPGSHFDAVISARLKETRGRRLLRPSSLHRPCTES